MDSTKLTGYAEVQYLAQKGTTMSPEAIIAESMHNVEQVSSYTGAVKPHHLNVSAEQQCPKCGSNNTEDSNLNIAGGDKLYIFCKDCHKHSKIIPDSSEELANDKPPAQVGGSHYEQAIEPELIDKLIKLGIVGSDNRQYNIGESNYSKHVIQPWSIWMDYNLDPWDADIVKRVLRTKTSDSRCMDYEKIIHICKEKIRHLSDA